MTHRKTSLALAACAALTCVSLLHCSSTTVVNAAPDDAGGEPEEDAEAPAPSCPTTQPTKAIAQLGDSAIKEASGIGASKKNPGVFWLHNDSGDTARAFAVGSDGALRATVAFDTAKPTDIEDMAMEDAADASYLYFGDIGDNDEARKSLTIHRVAEPTLGSGAAQALTVTSEKMTVTYPDGPHNAETLMFDPIDKVLVIFTKTTGAPSAFHRIGAFTAGGKATTEKIGEFTYELATGGEISRDGKYIAIRNYTKTGYLWVRGEGETLEQALAKKPCKIPIAAETQGEALDFLPDGTGYVTTSEGASAPINETLFK